MGVLVKKWQNGFTLIELVLVILVVSVLALNFSLTISSTQINTVAQAQQLANDIRYTQSLSMTSDQRYYLIKESANTYRIMNASGTPIILAGGSTTMTLGSGMSFGTLTNLPNNLIQFNGNGIPYTTSATTGGTTLASAATIPITAGTQTSTVTITPQTGEVAVS